MHETTNDMPKILKVGFWTNEIAAVAQTKLSSILHLRSMSHAAKLNENGSAGQQLVRR